MLLERAAISPIAAIERLAGLQAQMANAPYVGLWARLEGFERCDLTRLIEDRQVVRATMMRSTLHLATAGDYLTVRPALQPALSRALRTFFGQRAADIDVDRVVAAVRARMVARPVTFVELRALLSDLEPDRDVQALAYAVRTHLPLVQAPPGGTWNAGGIPAWALAEPWLGRPLVTPPDEGLRHLFRRYLAAFGPATVPDLQTWSGLTGLQGAVERLRPELRSYRDERGRELLDLPGAPLLSSDAPAPPRFLPEYDNLLLAHADRSRFVPDAYRPFVYLSAGRIRATFLVDGLVAGAWKIERVRATATLVVEPFAPLSEGAMKALAEEGERLVRFVEDDAQSFGVRFADPVCSR